MDLFTGLYERPHQGRVVEGTMLVQIPQYKEMQQPSNRGNRDQSKGHPRNLDGAKQKDPSRAQSINKYYQERSKHETRTTTKTKERMGKRRKEERKRWSVGRPGDTRRHLNGVRDRQRLKSGQKLAEIPHCIIHHPHGLWILVVTVELPILIDPRRLLLHSN